MTKSSLSLALLGLAVILVGCGGPHYQVNVGNGSPRLPVRQVKVSADSRTLGEFSVIAPQKVAAAKPRGGDLPEVISVQWMDTEGNPHLSSLSVAGRVPPSFKGQLVVEITAENTLSLTEVESSGEELSTLPWAMPESWEGSVQLPGME